VRVAGWILLIAGALLCATLVWATVGFLLMGVGLLSLLVAENNRKRAGHAAVHQPRTSHASARQHDRVDSVVAPPPVPEPVVHREAPTMISAPPRSYDRQAWRRLVESDADLARIAAVLADYGQPYVDELAKAYLADTDRKRLPEIVDAIIAKAGKGGASRGGARLVATRPANARPPDPAAAPDAAAPQPDRQPEPLPEVKPDFSENTFVSLPIERPAQEMAGAPVQPPVAVEPAPSAEDRNKTIVNADEELTTMLGKLSPDAATPKS
jgi:hypothetical protein